MPQQNSTGQVVPEPKTRKDALLNEYTEAQQLPDAYGHQIQAPGVLADRSWSGGSSGERKSRSNRASIVDIWS